MASSSSEISESLNTWMSNNSSIVSYVLINSDARTDVLSYCNGIKKAKKYICSNLLMNIGIPLKYNEDASYEHAVKQASLFLGLLTKTKKCVKELFPQENEFNNNLRIRTSKETEYILCNYGDYSLITQQNCKDMQNQK
ncbi:hypothetical protein YYE_01394 [Plasmodium vinckei vinckei]|nr:hypothetical protein YYE_01394 [Plasmodium vinckei vinckei]